jgi:hypothetical protein
VSSKFYNPPAFCLVHGLFPCKGIALEEGSGEGTFLGNTTVCPQCGRTAEIIPGQYDASTGGLKIRIDPSISADALVAIRNIAERLKRDEITPEEAEQEAAKISPAAANLFNLGKFPKSIRDTIINAIITSAITLGGNALLDSGSTYNVTNNINIINVVAEPKKWNPADLVRNTNMPKPRLKPSLGNYSKILHNSSSLAGIPRPRTKPLRTQ